MAIYNTGAIDFVVDNKGRYWIIDPITKTRYETGPPSSGSYKAAVVLYGAPRNVNTMLTGWNEHPGGAVDYFGGPNQMERVIAGLKPDPFTGYTVPTPQPITTASGQTFTPQGYTSGGTSSPTTGTNPYEGFDNAGNTARTVERWFREAGVEPGPGAIQRIVTEIMSGQRTPEHVFNSIQWVRNYLTDNPEAQLEAGHRLINGPRPGDTTSGEGSLTRAERDAFASTQALLAEYGLPSLADDVKEWILQGLSGVEIMQRIRATPEYKTRFPGMDARREAGLAPINEAQYIQLERQYRNILERAELPRGFYDTVDDFTNFIVNDISPAELETRVFDGIVAAQTAPREVRDALANYYGVGNTVSALAAYYLDPDKGEQAIIDEFRAAQIGGAATRTGWGSLMRTEAERLRGLDVTAEQAQRGFSELTRSDELFDALPGELGASTVDREEQLGATFEGDAEAAEEIRQQRERRLAAFAGAASQAMIGREGVTGLRSE